MKWRVTAAHTNGQSVQHLCQGREYPDPTESIHLTIEAESRSEAQRAGWGALDLQCADQIPCSCGQSGYVHYEDWEESAVVFAEPIAD